MGNRVHVPFDVFAMQVDVPVSTMVRDGGFGWTCGQCPLDRQGAVVSPGDLIAQALFVCDMIETVLRRAAFEAGSAARLHVYFVETRQGAGDALLDVLRKRLRHDPIIVLIPVPHFYYEGMLIEVDVFAGTGLGSRKVRHDGPVDFEIVEADGLVHVSARAEPGLSGTADIWLAAVEKSLRAEGLFADDLVSDHWFLSGVAEPSFLSPPPISGLLTNSDALVRVGGPGPARLTGSLSFSPGSPTGKIAADVEAGPRISGRRNERLCWIGGSHADPSGNLVDQTRTIMSGLAEALERQDMSFDNVTKLTAHYVGGASPEELHDNMIIRHGFYARPGPASTGLPVSALNNPHCRIAIDVVAIA